MSRLKEKSCPKEAKAKLVKIAIPPLVGVKETWTQRSEGARAYPHFTR